MEWFLLTVAGTVVKWIVEKCLIAVSASSSPFVVARTWPPNTPPKTAEIISTRTRQKIARDGLTFIE